jgi:hypothetical protein
VPRLCEFYPGICLTTEEKARKNLSQGKKNFRVRKTSVRVQCTYYQNTHTNTHITKPTQTHTLQNPHTHTHTHITKPTQTCTLQNQHIHTHTHKHTYTYTYIHTHTHITKQYKTTTVQIKTNTVQDIPK